MPDTWKKCQIIDCNMYILVKIHVIIPKVTKITYLFLVKTKINSELHLSMSVREKASSLNVN